MPFLNSLSWRFAAKEFNPNKPVSKKTIDQILQAVRMSPSSYGLQPYHIYVISDKNVLSQIYEKSYQQKQITTCSYLIIFCARTDKDDMSKRVAKYTTMADRGNKLSMKNSIESKSKDELFCWSNKQCYIALGFGLAACAELQIDSCPMEGFEKKEIDKILNLPTYLNSAVMLAIGYRKESPTREKFRFPQDDLFSYI